MKVETNAIILKTQKYKEYDEIILAFTEKYGKVRMFSRSSKRIKSPLLSGTQIFAYSKLALDLRENGSNLYEASLIKSFYDFSEDLSKYYLASYIVEVLDKMQVENQTDSRLFNRVISLFYAMLKYNNIKLIRLIFEIFIIDSLGIKPVTTKCEICGSEKQRDYKYFEMEHGTVVCDECKKNQINALRIDKNIFKFINFVYKHSKDIARILDAKISESLLNKLDDFLKKFIDFHFNGVEIKSYAILKEEEKYYDNFRNDRPSS